jgi:hypothetical protein
MTCIGHACILLCGHVWNFSAYLKIGFYVLQMKTGEGKSVVLGFCAIILALLGYQVFYI